MKTETNLNIIKKKCKRILQPNKKYYQDFINTSSLDFRKNYNIIVRKKSDPKKSYKEGENVYLEFLTFMEFHIRKRCQSGLSHSFKNEKLGIICPDWWLSLFQKDQGTLSSWESTEDYLGKKLQCMNYRYTFKKNDLPNLRNKADNWTCIYWEDDNKRIFRSIIKTLRFTYNDTTRMLTVGGSYDVEIKDMKENIWKKHI